MKNDYSKLLNHITDIETKQTIKKFIDSLFAVEKKGVSYCSDFFLPNEIKYCIDSVNSFSNMEYEVIPSEEFAERNCILLKGRENASGKDYIDYISCKNPSEEISHRDVLGSILGLGINRSKVGDILFIDDEIVIVIRNTLTNYILQNLLTISKYNVNFNLVDKVDFNNISKNEKYFFAIVSSLRYDVIVSEITNYSRNKASLLIKNGRVKVNHEVVNKMHLDICEGDIISIRGFGRFKYIENNGLTKKNKYKIKYLKYE